MIGKPPKEALNPAICLKLVHITKMRAETYVRQIKNRATLVKFL